MPPLASMWSISCNIQHLAQQQGQHKIQLSMLQKRTFCHIQRANTANQPSNPHDDAIKQMTANTALRQKGFEHWEHWAGYNPKGSVPWRKVGKGTFYAKKRENNGWRIMWMERPLWQESKIKTQRHRLSKSRKIWEMLKRHDRQPESMKYHLRR